MDVTDRDLRAQFELATRIRDAESAANQAVLDIRAFRTRLHERVAHDTLALVPAMVARINAAVAPLEQALADVEAAIYQVRNQSPKDKIAFPIRLNDRLTGLRSIVETGDAPPTDAQQRVYRELRAELDRHLGRRRGRDRGGLRGGVERGRGCGGPCRRGGVHPDRAEPGAGQAGRKLP